MTDSEQREAARQFANKWKNGGNEDQDGRTFWIELLQNIMGVDHPTEYVNFEKRVQLFEDDGKKHTRRIDEYIPDVRVLIEMKGSEHPLDVPEPQSGGAMLTPVQQAERYNNALPFDEKARWIVTCNFKNIWIYDMNQSMPEENPTKIEIVDLQQKYPMLDFLVKKDVKEISHEMEVSIKAGDIVGLLYEAFLKQYGIPEAVPKNETEEDKKKREGKLRSLNALCVRLVFCLYAEDTDIFGKRNLFHDFLEPIPVEYCMNDMLKLFKTLDTPIDERPDYLEDRFMQFPYVNGGLFADETVEVPPFTEEIKNLILKNASEDFNWRDISPTIFGAVFESTLNPETRRSGGMHYTSIENIHKVIDPLFLDDLKAEFDDICKIKQPGDEKKQLLAFQDKLASLTFLDPACGSGNFLTETYLSLRRLENKVIRELSDMDNKQISGQISFVGTSYPIKVSIQQFYGIEINDFAVTVAKTALWIAESQMLDETKTIEYLNVNFLPLKTYVNITEGNALRIDWNEVVDKNELNYIMGNPPFVGAMWSKGSQRDDISIVFPECSKPGQVDYVSGWYVKAAKYVAGSEIRCAFVSTNSICQGQQVSLLWKPMMEQFGMKIDFCYHTFRWDSEASIKAHVHCIIVGFSDKAVASEKVIYDNDIRNNVTHINGYLAAADDVFIDGRKEQISGMPLMHMGVMARDGGNLIMSQEEYEEYMQKEPQGRQFIHKYMMGREFINNIPRYCFWLLNVSPAEIKMCPLLMERIKRVREARLGSSAAETRKLAETPALFAQLNQPTSSFVAFPKVSSQRRRYIPIGFLDKSVIVGDKLYVVENVGLYHFGILTSNIHNAWMRSVAGRLKSDYSYSNTIVYNNFPWPSPTDSQKQTIEKTAQGILDARALYPDSSLADLYDPLTMPSELRKAHTTNDIAVMKAYGFDTKMTEADCVAELMKMYQQLVEAQ